MRKYSKVKIFCNGHMGDLQKEINDFLEQFDKPGSEMELGNIQISNSEEDVVAMITYIEWC